VPAPSDGTRKANSTIALAPLAKPSTLTRSTFCASLVALMIALCAPPRAEQAEAAEGLRADKHAAHRIPGDVEQVGRLDVEIDNDGRRRRRGIVVRDADVEIAIVDRFVVRFVGGVVPEDLAALQDHHGGGLGDLDLAGLLDGVDVADGDGVEAGDDAGLAVIVLDDLTGRERRHRDARGRGALVDVSGFTHG
jgi:hypothetical protein